MEAELRSEQRAARDALSRLVRWGTAGVVAVCVIIPMLGVFRVAYYDPDPADTVRALAATVGILPVQIWLVLAAMRGALSARHRWALATVAAVVVGLVPVIGMNWLAAFYPLSVLVLVVIDRPWSIITFAGLVVAAVPLTLVLGDARWSVYFAFGTLMYGISVAVPVWLIAAVRQLEAARLVLADEAVVRERLRIDGELRRTVGTALETIVAAGERASGQAPHSPAGAKSELHALVDGSRRAMSETRRMVAHYRSVPLRAELQSAAALLTASGIQTRFDVPPDLPEHLDQGQRAALRADVTRLLREEGGRGYAYTVIWRDGGIRLEPRQGPDGPGRMDVVAT